ncbi:MAG: hypothetical protein SCK70_08660, partial [bacterium]|nr:hypothetical protein [bacterium]
MVRTKTKNKSYTYFQALQHFVEDKLFPAYLLYGEEVYLQEELIDRASEKLIDTATRDFNFDQFYAGEVDAQIVIDAAKSYPMVAERRLV